MILDILTVIYQLEILGDEDQYMQDGGFDGIKRCNYIRATVNPKTTTGASECKDEIELQTIDDFEHNVKNYNTWFNDTRNEILKLEWKGKYNESNDE